MAEAPIGSVYRPRGSVAGPDEDGFTMVVAALEGLGDTVLDARPTTTILVGDAPSTAPEDLARYLGLSDPPLPEAVASLPAALARLASGAGNGTPALLLGAHLPSRSPVGAGPREGGGEDEAVAIWFPDSASVVDLERQGIERWDDLAGRWRPPTGSGGPSPSLELVARPEVALRPDLPVAQGAYTPWPRYVEGIPAHWRLVAERCAACGKVSFPPRGRCRACDATAGLEKVRLNRDEGSVVAATTIGPGGQPTEFDEQVSLSGPYGVAVVEFGPGLRATLQLTDVDRPTAPIGARVRTRLRRIYTMEGRWRYARKAIPAPGPVAA